MKNTIFFAKMLIVYEATLLLVQNTLNNKVSLVIRITLYLIFSGVAVIRVCEHN